ncbi:MAG: hypothetical protein K2J74_00365 [Muribaculaceae bacterium]|nr:hypothetical protein [Muribaculaceae bacterium]
MSRDAGEASHRSWLAVGKCQTEEDNCEAIIDQGSARQKMRAKASHRFWGTVCEAKPREVILPIPSSNLARRP